jgi:NAD(P)-dependent dehydrogenase (short-subunit alcohol dehydrogenase family)
MDIFRGKVAFITGAASGIGRALALTLAKSGCVVVVTDIDGDGALEVAKEVLVAGGGARAVTLDVSDPAAVTEAIRDCAKRHGRIDYLFNNAGIAVGGDFRDIAEDDLRRIVDINLWGVINGIRAAYPLMVQQRGGHIVNTASLAGLVPFAPVAPYALTKHAVVGLTESLRAEAHRLGVRFTAICPGFIQTNIYANSRMAGLPEGAVKDLTVVAPMDVQDAARRILKGVARNKALVVFPFSAWLLWWVYRLSPSLLAPVARVMAERYRQAMRI